MCIISSLFYFWLFREELKLKRRWDQSVQRLLYHCLFFIWRNHLFWIVTGNSRATDAQEAFFHWNPKLLGLSRQFGPINFGAFGVFSANLSAPILILWVPCPCFPLINHYFYKKLSLYIHIPNIYLGFGLYRISDLAYVCP